MVIDGCSKILEFAPSGCSGHLPCRPPSHVRLGRFPHLPLSVFDIGPAGRTVHRTKGPIAPPRIERQNTLLGFDLTSVLRRNVGEVDRQYVGD
jgi:hypothetical protein